MVGELKIRITGFSVKTKKRKRLDSWGAPSVCTIAVATAKTKIVLFREQL